MGPPREVAQSVSGRVYPPAAIPEIPHSIPSILPAGFSDEMLESEVFHRILDLVPAMIWVAKADSKAIYLNRSWVQFTGRKLEQELGDGWAECVHADDLQSCMDTYLAAVEGHRAFRIEYRLRRRDGEYRWLLDTGVPFYHEDERLAGFIGSCIDITEHKQTAEALQEAEERYRSVVTAMTEGVVVIDDVGVIYLCNSSAERILGLSARDMIGRPVKDSRWGAIHEDGSTFPPESFPAVVTLTTGRACKNVLMGLPKKDVGVVWLSINTQPLFGEENSRSRGVVATFVDVTERKRAEQALHRAHEQLEQRVRDRTAELEDANQRLRVEMDVREWAERELKESEERYRVVLSRAPDAIFLHDGEHFLFANQQTASFFGVAGPSDLVGRSVWDFIRPQDQEPIRRRITYLKSEKGLLPTLEMTIARPDGTELLIETTATACPYQGRMVIQGIARDISARREADQALRRSAEQISDLYNHAPCGYHSLDANGVVVRMNDTELNWLGYRREEIVGIMRFDELMPAKAKEMFPARFERLKQSGTIRDLEIQLLRKDGTVLPAVLNATVVRDDTGHFVMTRSTVFDMTELKRAGRALRESEERFRRLAEASSEGIAIHADGTILDANEALAAMFGYDRHELIGKIRAELVVPAAKIGGADSTGGPSHVLDEKSHETLGVRRDGSTFPIEIRGKAIPYQGRTAYVTAVRDLTERKLIEHRARQHQEELAHVLRLSTMGETAAGLAHELNQPLATIINYAHGCLRRIQAGSGSPAEFVEVLQQVAQQAGRAGEIIRRLRNFARKQESQLSKIKINEVVREAAAFLLPEARELGLTIKLELTEGLPEIEADMIQIEQVLLNLLRNACEAVRDLTERPRQIAVRTELGERGMIEVAVRDTGPGLSSGVAERLFQPFCTTKPEGMGLGLSISKSIIESHGGRLSAIPNADHGMTFRFALPAVGLARPAL